MLPILLTVFASVTAVPAVVDVPGQDPAIRVWLNQGDYVERTEKVRAYVRTGMDGYVLILHAEPSGRVRVLFPLDPEDDAWVRAGQDYEIRSRGDKEAFRIYDGTGPGVVLAAISRDPFRLDGLVVNRHWDYRAAAFGVGNDPEADLLALVQQISGGAWFDYDVTRYQLADYFIAEGGDATYHLSLYGPAYAGHYWAGGVGFSIGFGFGWYDPWYSYDPWYWGGCCGYGWYYPWAGYGYGYGWGYYPSYPYYPYYPYYPGYGYPPGYYAPGGPSYPGHYYATGSYGTNYYYSQGGAWGSYAFKSSNDRYGLNQGAVTARRRAPGTGGTYASSQGSPSAAGRRTTAASSPASTGAPAGAAAGRRTAAASSATSAGAPRPAGGSLERRPAGTASDPTTVLPTVSGRQRTPAAGSGATAGSQNTGTATRRQVSRPSETPGTGGAARERASTAAGTSATPAASQGRRTPAGTGTSAGLRQITPRRVDEALPGSDATRTTTRQPQGTVGSGSTTRSSGGSLERRTPSRDATPSTRSTPSRSTPSTRSTPSRSTPSTRSAPSRSSGSRAAPSSRPSMGRSSPSSSGRSSPSSSGGRRR